MQLINVHMPTFQSRATNDFFYMKQACTGILLSSVQCMLRKQCPMHVTQIFDCMHYRYIIQSFANVFFRCIEISPYWQNLNPMLTVALKRG